jgi:ABC-type lipoprotein export system ATPase subunit
MSDQSLVEFHGVARTFGEGPRAVVAVHGADGAVHSSDRIALMGVSGSGKSTLLHLLAGLDHATAGLIRWPAFGDESTLRPMGIRVVFQGMSLLEPLTVVENVELPALLAGVDGTSARTAALAALDGLALLPLADRLPDELSGGESQKVAVARALAGRARLILADEPTGQIDHDSGAAVIDALLDFAERHDVGLLVATHDVRVAERFASCWVMADGRLFMLEAGACPP